MPKESKTVTSRKVAIASFVGTAIEWYDFYLFGTASALIFNELFFPSYEPIMGTMAAFATLAVGFFCRPLGGLLFGHFGDKIGRKNMLIITISMMGLATFFIGLLPTYQQIGIFAPLLLVFLRCFQGIGVGGEWGGAIVLTAEHSLIKDRGYYTSWPNAGAPIGLCAAIGAYLAVSSMSHEQFVSWGWRLPFLSGIILLGVGLYIRLEIFDSTLFTSEKKSKLPAAEILRKSPKNFVLAVGARFAESSSYYIFTVFSLSYATEQLQLTKNIILYAVLIASLIEVGTVIIFGTLSDRYGRRPVYIGGAIMVGLFAFPFFWMLQTKNTYFIIIAMILGLALFHAAMHGAQAAFFSELFKTRVRYSGTAIAYHLSAALSGGIAPFLATWMVWSAGNTWPVSLYIISMSIVTIMSVFLAVETARTKIS